MKPLVMAFAAIVPAVWALNALTTQPAPIVAKAVTVEDVHEQRKDANSFTMRWSNVALMPPTIETKYEPLLLVSHDTPMRMSPAAASVRPAVRIAHHEQRTCVRHRMRTIWIRGGRSWRCRR